MGRDGRDRTERQSYEFNAGKPSCKIKYNLIASAIGLGLTIILDLYLIPRFGINGASIASVVSYAGVFVTVFAFVTLKLNYGISNYFIVGRKDLGRLQNMISGNVNPVS